MNLRPWLFPGLLGSLFCVPGAHAQRMASVSVTPSVIIPVHTARNHLTLLDLDSPIEDVAAEDTPFDIEWRGHTVFLIPKTTDRSTNLFVWTKNGRVVYELLPPADSIQGMDVSVDTHFPVHAPATQLTSTPAAPDTLATDLLVRAQAVEPDSKKVRQQSNLLISDVYRRQDNLYLRYEVRNNGSDHLKLDEPPVITAASLPHVSFKKPLQLSPDKAAHITTGAPLPLIADQAGASSLAPGQTSRGIIGVHIPPGSNPLAVRVSVPSKPAPLQALVVLP